MNHIPYEDWLFEQETLTDQQAGELREHLQACQACRALEDSLHSVEASLRAQEIVAPAEGFGDRWQARLDAQRQRAHRRQTRSVLILSVGGAVALVALLLVLFWPWLRSPEALVWVGLYRMLMLYGYVLGLGETFGGLFRSAGSLIPWVVWFFAIGLLSELSVLWVVSYRLLTNPRRITK